MSRPDFNFLNELSNYTSDYRNDNYSKNSLIKINKGDILLITDRSGTKKKKKKKIRTKPVNHDTIDASFSYADFI